MDGAVSLPATVKQEEQYGLVVFTAENVADLETLRKLASELGIQRDISKDQPVLKAARDQILRRDYARDIALQSK